VQDGFPKGFWRSRSGHERIVVDGPRLVKYIVPVSVASGGDSRSTKAGGLMADARGNEQMAMLYFGCWSEPGHYLHRSDGMRFYGEQSSSPFSAAQLDGVFAPRGVNGRDDVATLTHVHGWTVLAMWDYSVDKRPGSNAAFLIPGTHVEAEVWRQAAAVFPSVVARLKAARTVDAAHVGGSHV
jgi:hypothetical protein